MMSSASALVSSHDRFSNPAARWLRASLLALCALAAVPAAHAVESALDSMVVRLRDNVAFASSGLPAATHDALEAALHVQFTVTGRTRDGAFVLRFPQSLDLDTARAAINRVRLDPAILYANPTPGSPVPDKSGRPTDRIIVRYRDPSLTSGAKSGAPLAAARVAKLAALAGQPVAWLRGTHDGGNVLQLLQRHPIGDVEVIAAHIAEDADVEFAQPDYIRTTQIVPTDPCYASASTGECTGGFQWDLFDAVGGINMPTAWDITTGSTAINVAVLDTGALVDHPDLAGRFVGGYDMIADCAFANDDQPSPCTWAAQNPDSGSRDDDAADTGDWISGAESTGLGTSAPPYDWFKGCRADISTWHGTHVAGTIGAIANNGIGITGINWVSKIVPVRVLGKCGGYTSDIADAIVWAAGGNVAGLPANVNPARVISLSLGGGGSCDPVSQDAINTALGLNAVVIVAAGNNNDDVSGHSPASCSGVITVAAMNRAGLRSWYSNYGAMVEIAAPGGSADGSDSDILSTLNDGVTSPNPSGYIYSNYAGTSMATPHVSGVASLMLSANPSLTPAQVLSKIQTTARVFPTPGPVCGPMPPSQPACNCTTALCGSGILDAGAAVASAIGADTALASSANPALYGAAVTFTATVSGIDPTGSVDFKDAGTSIAGCDAVALTGSGSAKTAQCVTAMLLPGSHGIVAIYGGDAGNASTSSPPLVQTIDVPPGTTLISSLNPANYAELVTLTAFVTNSNASDRVNFKDGAMSIVGCSSVTLGGSGSVKTAVCSTSALSVGVHSLKAVHGNVRGIAFSTSPPLSQAINGTGPTSSTTGIVSSANPSPVGAAVTFTATVTGVDPTGSVDFKVDGASTAGCDAVALAGSGNFKTAQCVTTTLLPGSHDVVAIYGGDAGNASSSSPPMVQTINVPPGTTLISSLNPANFGVLVTLTAHVTSTSLVGNVDFKDGAVSIGGCTGVPLSGGGGDKTAVCNTSALSVGVHSLSAVYSGARGSAPSTSAPLSQVIIGAGPTPSTTGITSSANPSTVGAGVTFTATVTGLQPTGNVDFRDGALSIAGCSSVAVIGSGNSRSAQCTTSTLTQGAHDVVASYGGDPGNLASSSPTLSQVIDPAGVAPTTTALVSSPNPSTVGAMVSFTATVTGSSPTGTVDFRDGGVSIAGCSGVTLTGTDNSRVAQCSTNAFAPGTHGVSAYYGGNPGNAPSTSGTLSQFVNVCIPLPRRPC